MIKAEHLFKGRPSPLPHNTDVVSAINRAAVPDLNVFHDHIEGDEVFNKIHHGGLHRVIHYYPSEHYKYWNKQYPGNSFLPGSMGENISATGMTEKDVCIGDIFQIGEVLCTVTEPRKPCATINHKFQIRSLAKEVQITSRTGWFYKVLVPGIIKINNEIILKDRPYPELSLEKCIQALLISPNRELLEIMAHNESLSENWRRPAREYLNTGLLPDDRKRLGDT